MKSMPYYKHTHERVDQVFSRFSVALNKVACLTPEAMVEMLKKSFTPAPTFEKLEHILDFTDYLGPHLHDVIKNITLPHQFIIKRAAGAAVSSNVETSEWSNTELWPAVEVLTKMPGGAPTTSAARPIFGKIEHDGNPKLAAEAFNKCRAQVEDIAHRYAWRAEDKEGWAALFLELEDRENAEPDVYPFEWWPESKDEVNQRIAKLSGAEVSEDHWGTGKLSHNMFDDAPTIFTCC